MRLKTSHGTYVVMGRTGELRHISAPLYLDFQPVLTEVPPQKSVAGLVEATITEGPLAPSTAVILPNGLAAFRRNGRYLCAEPARSELRFDRTNIGPWERFAIESDEASDCGTFSKNAIGNSTWIDLKSLPNSLKPAQTESADDFRTLKSAKLLLREEEYIYAPITMRYEDLKFMQTEAKVHFPTELNKEYHSICSISKAESKYVVLTDASSGIVFDRAGFLTNPGFLQLGGVNEYTCAIDDVYYLNFDLIYRLEEIDVNICVFYDGNYSNYYHWWAECLVNLQVAELVMGLLPPVYVWNGRPKLSSWQIASLNLLGVEIIYRDVGVSHVVRAREVTWFDRDTAYVPGFLLRRLRDRVLEKTPNPSSSGRKIYIKRQHHRGIKNAIELEEMLISLGYEVIVAEYYSQIEQIILFRSAKVIVGAHGAGLTNMLFMPEGSMVIELMPNVEVRTFFWIMAEKLYHKYAVLVGQSSENNFDSAIEINLSDLRTLIDIGEAHAGFAVREPQS